ncbi:MAG: hypothetical protein AB1714_27485 [Acidobacteriota bacterium]
MKSIAGAVVAIMFLGYSLLMGQGDEQKEFGTYQEMRVRVGELYAQQKYKEAADILEGAIERFPEKLLANTYNLALMRLLVGDTEKAVATLESGLDRGIWFGKFDFLAEQWEPLKASESFKRFAEKNEAMMREAQKQAAMRLEIVTPEGYRADKSYPLFIALHGGGENTADLRPHWVSEKLKKEYIVAFVQSSQLVAMDGYTWEDLKTSAKEIGEAYRSVCEKHAVKKEDVVVGGFSSGGFASLAVALTNVIPVTGFIALCPGVPEEVTDEDIRRAADLGVRGTAKTWGSSPD